MRTGKSLGSKTVLFTQSKYGIDLADRTDLVPSILTAKHLDFLKAEPLTRLKPGVLDDGRMDASFLKAFLIHLWLDVVSFIRDFGVFICEICLQVQIARYTILHYQ